MAVTKDPLTRRRDSLAIVFRFIAGNRDITRIGFSIYLRLPEIFSELFGITGCALGGFSSAFGKYVSFTVLIRMVREEGFSNAVICSPNLTFLLD